MTAEEENHSETTIKKEFENVHESEKSEINDKASKGEENVIFMKKEEELT